MIFKSNHKSYTLFVVVIFCLVFTACTSVDVFEKNTVIPKYEWKNDFTVTGNFTIKDTLTRYNIYVVLRHRDAYKYNNIWLSIGLNAQGDSAFTQKLDLRLGNDVTGWEGTGMDNIWEVRKRITDEPWRPKKSGTYNFSIAHIMRDNPLSNIMSVGLRIEKVQH